MLSHFKWRSGKRKGNKANSRSHQKSPSASSSIMPLVFNINIRDSVSLETALFRELDAKVAESDLTRANSLPLLKPRHSEDPPPRAAARKKSIPAPILIPDTELHAPDIQIGHSAVSTAPPVFPTPRPVTNDVPLSPPSPSPSDNLSSISGTTLARALIASTFVLSSSERPSSSRHRSLVRQDSATLPCRESGFQSESGRSSPIPPVPPVPATLASMPPDKEKTGPVPMRPRAIVNESFDGPKSAVEPPLPLNAQGTTRPLSQVDSSTLSSDHSLDEFDFVPPEPIVFTSPASESSASYTSPLPRRNDAKQKRRLGGGNFIRNGFKYSSGALAPPQQSHSIPSAAASENDFGELLNCDLTVSPSSSSSQGLSSGSAGYQTFPETPMVFSPLWSPTYALRSKSDTQVLRTHPVRPPKHAVVSERTAHPPVSASSSPPLPQSLPSVTTTNTAASQPDISKPPFLSASFPEETFLRSRPSFISASSDESPSRLLPPMLITTPSDMSISPSFFPPPPYHAVVLERTAYHTAPASPPSLPSSSSSDHDYQRRRHISSSSSGSTRYRGRIRPAPPIGPRKPSGLGQALGAYVPEVHGRDASESSIASGVLPGFSGSPWRTLQAAAAKPPPKFRFPPPKWRGLTLEAAQWTFTSAQLQEVVSRAIQQSSDGSSIRLLRLEVLEGEIADEMHRLELLHTDLKAQYKAFVRKRWTLMGTLASHVECVETSDASQTIEALTEVLMELDYVADKMHDTVLRMSQLKSLCDVHNASALALAVRKINGVFVRQVAEKERLQERTDTLVTERDEAWKHAEDIAKDYDALNERVSETVRAEGVADFKIEDESLRDTSRRSTRILAVRNSSMLMSRSGLRSRSRHRAGTRPSSLALEDLIPPVPLLVVNTPEGVALSADSMYSCETGTSEALALADAQREVYEMLGLSITPSQASSRCRTMSFPEERMSTLLRSPTLHASGARVRPRSASETLHDHAHAHVHAHGRSFQERGRAKSVFIA